jgi:diacylglycerol kinase family enzyme
VWVETSGAIPFHVDGEPRLGREQLHVHALPGALKVRVPAV